ncbi:MAG: hypothetical protein WC694_01210 [Candidatus Paceibacterota bacterium]|jgi:hypothetical protein
MTKKQFIVLIVAILLIPIMYLYNVRSVSAARKRCAEYAMPLVGASFPDAFAESGYNFPPKRIKAEYSQDFKANYDIFFNFCMDHFEVKG